MRAPSHACGRWGARNAAAGAACLPGTALSSTDRRCPARALRPPADCAIVVLYARLLLPASAAVLAAASAASLLSGPRMCLRVLEAEAVEAPLEQLHGLVGLSL